MKTESVIDDARLAVLAWQRSIAGKGGGRNTKAQRAARTKNAEIARSKRWPKNK